MKLKQLMLGLFGLLANCAIAQSNLAASGDYFNDFKKLKMSLDGIVWTRDLCVVAMPETRDANDRAYALWLERHQTLLDETESQLALLERAGVFERLQNMAVPMPQSVMAQLGKSFKDGFRESAPATQAMMCANYVTLASDPEFDFSTKNTAFVAAFKKESATLLAAVSKSKGEVLAITSPLPLAALIAPDCGKLQVLAQPDKTSQSATVRMLLLIDEGGKVIGSTVSGSSGDERLDQATRAIGKCTFRPIGVNGSTTQAWARWNYTWRTE